jgi:hypothetical protein
MESRSWMRTLMWLRIKAWPNGRLLIGRKVIEDMESEMVT